MSVGKYTSLWRNSMTGNLGFCGTFDSVEAAVAYQDREAERTRSFVTYEVWTGTPRKPGCAVAGTVRRGIK